MRSLLVLIICLGLMGCQGAIAPTGLTIQVQQVLTGRELEVAGIAAQPDITERVRLEGIDVPDLSQRPWGEAAKKLLQQAIDRQPVLLESDVEPRDEQGQRLAYVWQKDVLLNEKLVAAGFALAVSHPPNRKYDQRLARAQDQARTLGLGIWNPNDPMRDLPAEVRGEGKKF